LKRLKLAWKIWKHFGAIQTPSWNRSYPLVMTNIAIENGHRNSGFSHEKWWFSIAMLNYQRVICKFIQILYDLQEYSYPSIDFRSWRFPKSWGYPLASSIVFSDPWNKPSSYCGTKIMWTPPYIHSSSMWSSSKPRTLRMTWAVRLPQWKVGDGGDLWRSLLVTLPSNAEVSFNLTLFDIVWHDLRWFKYKLWGIHDPIPSRKGNIWFGNHLRRDMLLDIFQHVFDARV
jgi:hypothetical protein